MRPNQHGSPRVVQSWGQCARLRCGSQYKRQLASARLNSVQLDLRRAVITAIK